MYAHLDSLGPGRWLVRVTTDDNREELCRFEYESDASSPEKLRPRALAEARIRFPDKFLATE